jgi:hypothetical protein
MHLDDTIHMQDLEALAQERGLQADELATIYLHAACVILELHGVQAELSDARPQTDADAVQTVRIPDLFRLHGIDPGLGLYQFKLVVQGLLNYANQHTPSPDESIERTLERNELFAKLVRTTVSPDDLEIALRVEQELARRGLKPDQVDQLLPPSENEVSHHSARTAAAHGADSIDAKRHRGRLC